MKSGYRIEKDSLGDVKVPIDVYWGAQTQRAINNFDIGSGWSIMPMEIIKALAYLKKAAAHANSELTILEQEKKNLISLVCDEIIAGILNDHFPLVVWQSGSGTQTNMNVNEVIANRAHVIEGNILGQGKRRLHPNDDVNKSQSTNDIISSAMNIAAYRMIVESTLPAAESLKESLNEKSEQFRDYIKVGRTHLMDAVPVTLGQEFSGYASQLEHGIIAVTNTLPHLSELAMGGTAVGTGLNSPAGFTELAIEKIAEFTGLPFISAVNKFEAIAAHDAIVETHGSLKQLAVSLMKIANDIRLLASGPRSGIAEILLPGNEPGSSIMPGKVNPTQCEAMTMVCAQVLGNDVAVSIGGMHGQLELNVFKPLLALNILTSAKLVADTSRSFSRYCITGIKPNSKNLLKNLENSLMLITALNPHIGYDKAAEIAQMANKNGTTLKQAAIKLGYLTSEQYDDWADPRKMLGPEKFED